MKKSFGSVLLICGLSSACAAPAPGSVPGLMPARDAARIFAPDVVSTGDASCPAFTPDGKSLFFMRERGANYSILTSSYSEGQWSEPAPASFTSEHGDIDPFVTPDGSLVLFASRRPLTGTAAPTEGFQLWSAPVDGGAEPTPFGPPLEPEYTRWFATLTAEGTAYFTNRHADGATGNDIARSTRGPSGYRPAEPVPELNSPYSDSNPLIAPDESFIVFFSARPGGFGASDLYVSFREGDGWTEPRNLGPLVNSPDFENCPALSPDGEYLFFARGRRNSENQVVSRNIHYIEAAAVLNR